MDLEEPKVFHMHCQEPWFSYIRQGVKPVEGRKNSPKHRTIRSGDYIDFSNGKESFRAIVTHIRHYPSLEEYLEDVGFQKALPGISSFDKAVQTYLQWSTLEEIKELGFLGIFVKALI